MASKNNNYYDIYDLRFLDTILKVAPIIGLTAAITFTGAKLFNLIPRTGLPALLSFDILCFSYCVIAFILRKVNLRVAEKNYRRIINIGKGMVIFLTILQWNVISVLFPSREMWGYAGLFVILVAMFFDSKALAIDMICLSVSIGVTWYFIPELMPERDSDFTFSFSLRIVALVLTFVCFYILCKKGENFKVTVRKDISEMVKKNNEIAEAKQEFVRFAADMVEERDSYSGSHTKRVEYYTAIFAEYVKIHFPEYRLTDEDVDDISKASSLHDVGKIKIPDSILLKPAAVDEKEYEIMKNHTVYGAEIVSALPKSMGSGFIKYCHDICLYHHERWDGNGYPSGLKRDAIPIAAQIVALADCFDALTTERPYHDISAPETAREMICNNECGAFSYKMKECLNENFDKIVEVFKELSASSASAK